jgi:hypothetical protein
MAKTQEKNNDQMSLREAGQFDMKFRVGDRRVVTTRWTAVSNDRRDRGVSRKARVARKKEGA